MFNHKETGVTLLDCSLRKFEGNVKSEWPGKKRNIAEKRRFL